MRQWRAVGDGDDGVERTGDVELERRRRDEHVRREQSEQTAEERAPAELATDAGRDLPDAVRRVEDGHGRRIRPAAEPVADELREDERELLREPDRLSLAAGVEVDRDHRAG